MISKLKSMVEMKALELAIVAAALAVAYLLGRK
ncbi:hypothetical protein Arcve_0676 [Archaeoglobus veneficus SNP6]|uniref:Uncharacterized protein n=1 Tax=Archaeoglobus veneficus (strain DSM 11195 / SNP6) TaxID=693661 RepID=F2KR59_ARCVS|nr:hypothetical protein Arcve_0676 [Archaeoglobus veneficus SNP6]